MDYYQRAEAIKGNKGGSRIGAFNQGTFRTELGQKLPPAGMQFTRAGSHHELAPEGRAQVLSTTTSGKSLGGGYCSGVCMDWIRRVLFSSMDRDKSFLTYGYEALKENKGTRKKDGSERDLEASKQRAYRSVRGMAEAYDKPLVWHGTSTRDTYELLPATWQATARSLDTSYQDGGRAFKKRFSQLTVIRSKSATYNAAGPTYWTNEVMNHGLQVDHATYLAFNAPGAAGHGVAVWQRETDVNSNDAFYLFDPNFGVFSFNKEALEDALTVMFWMDADNTPVYDDCTAMAGARVAYAIFGDLAVVEATRAEQLRTATVARIAASAPDMASAMAKLAELRAKATASASTYSTPSTGIPEAGPKHKPKPATAPTPAADSKLQPAQKARLRSGLTERLQDANSRKDKFPGQPDYPKGYVELSPNMAALIEREFPGVRGKGSKGILRDTSSSRIGIRKEVLEGIIKRLQ
jgi:hypothetical protein